MAQNGPVTPIRGAWTMRHLPHRIMTPVGTGGSHGTPLTAARIPARDTATVADRCVRAANRAFRRMARSRPGARARAWRLGPWRRSGRIASRAAARRWGPRRRAPRRRRVERRRRAANAPGTTVRRMAGPDPAGGRGSLERRQCAGRQRAAWWRLAGWRLAGGRDPLGSAAAICAGWRSPRRWHLEQWRTKRRPVATPGRLRLVAPAG